VREEILSRIRAVVSFPSQGHKRPDLTSRPLRFILVREYLIAYAPEEKGCRGHPRTPQTPRDGRNTASGKRVIFSDVFPNLGYVPRRKRVEPKALLCGH